MLAIQARSLITSLKSLLLPASFSNYKDGIDWRTCRGLIFSLDVQISDNVRGHPNEARQTIHVAILGSHSAFMTTTPLFGWDTSTKWKNVGNHDSCWIDSVDTELTQTYFAMCNQVNNKKAPVALSQYSTLNLFRPVSFVEATLDWDQARNKADDQQYWKQIQILRVLTKAEFDAYDHKEL